MEILLVKYSYDIFYNDIRIIHIHFSSHTMFTTLNDRLTSYKLIIDNSNISIKYNCAFYNSIPPNQK